MKIQVWDSYALSHTGRVHHFDILVPDSNPSEQSILSFGQNYLAQINFEGPELNVNRCQFCHVEEPTEKVLKDIDCNGYSIIDLGFIESNLPANPNRRELILFLRAFHDEYRYFNFSSHSLEDIIEIRDALINQDKNS